MQKRYHASVCKSVTSLMGWREKARCLPARQNDAIGPSVWTGRVLQAESDDLAPKGHLITNAWRELSPSPHFDSHGRWP